MVTVEKQIEIIFNYLKKGMHSTLPPFGTLTNEFEKLVDKSGDVPEVPLKPKQSALFASAAVEVWQRGIHSFLISASTTEASPLWSAVSGYYASHYCVRGLAHLLGYYTLFRKKRILKIDIINGEHICKFMKKGKDDREHRYYWDIVKKEPFFKNDPFFTTNPEDTSPSDIANRSKANYLDHLNNFPQFLPLDSEKLKNRIQFLSAMELSDVPIPNRQNCPDVNNVQLVAYHRITKFRKFLDNILGGKNNFWRVHREPTWSREYIDFQVVEPDFTMAQGLQI